MGGLYGRNIVFGCDSDKNSLAIIYICFKMHFLKYVGVIILFLFYTVHVDQVWLSNVPMCPAPCPSDHSNLLCSSAAPPPSSHQVQKRYQRHREERPCVYGQTGHFWGSPPLLLSGFLLKAAHFYCISSSTRRALEVCTSHSSSGCSTAFFPLHYSIDVSFLLFLVYRWLFWPLMLFSPNVEF